VVGDAPLDVLERALREVDQTYVDALGRPPTAEELEHLLDLAVFGAARTRSISGQIVTGARLLLAPSSHLDLKPGSFVAIPVTPVGWVFGRVLPSDDWPGMGTLIAVYQHVSRRLLPGDEIGTAPLLMSPFFLSTDGFDASGWRIVGHKALEPDEFVAPTFKEGAEGLGWFVRQGNVSRPASPEDVRGLEYAAIRTLNGAQRKIARRLAEIGLLPSTQR
jgi:hypothetical protein